MKKSFAQKIGSFLANIQAIFDNLFIIIFKMLKKVSQESPKKKATKKIPQSPPVKQLFITRRIQHNFLEKSENLFIQSMRRLKERKQRTNNLFKPVYIFCSIYTPTDTFATRKTLSFKAKPVSKH